MTPDRDGVLETLRTVLDPEVGVNVVDLGLVRDIDVSGADLHVRMTMTTPACPLGEWISAEAEAALRTRWPALGTVAVDVSAFPPWDPSWMTDEGRRQLGWG